MCQEKKEEEDLPTLKIASISIRRLEDYMKKSNKRLIRATRHNTNNTRIIRTVITRKQKVERKSNFKDISSSRQAKSQTRKLDMVNKGKP